MLKLIEEYKVILVVALLITISSLFIYFKQIGLATCTTYELTKEIEEPIQEDQIKEDPVKEDIPVFICGAVTYPGVYYMPVDTLVNELVSKAGGFSDESDKEQINLARTIKAHEKIYIPKINEQIDKNNNSYDNREEQIAESSLININEADDTKLDSLPGIGLTRAKNIIAYRQEHGLFKTIEDLKNVPGIGGKIYETIELLITVE